MFFCGIDIGTTNVKGILIDNDGHILDTVKISAQLNGIKGQLSNSWLQQFQKIIESLKIPSSGSSTICSIASQGGSFIFLDNGYKPVSRQFSWVELADDKHKNDLSKEFESDLFHHKTGWFPDKWLACCKIRKALNGLETKKRTRHVAFVPEFIHASICGKYKTDITNAQITGLCDFSYGQWGDDLCRWAGIESNCLADILTKPQVFVENVKVSDKPISLATSIHDQYAAMAATEIKPDSEVMLATGTAWVINARTSSPVFDDKNHFMHPGKDILTDGYGNIITLGPIGRQFDTLLDKTGITLKDFAEIEKKFDLKNVPSGKLIWDVWDTKQTFPSFENSALTIQRYMQFTASCAAFYIEKLSRKYQIDKIIMTGGATKSYFWPQLVSDICNARVEVLEFDELTAFGAANVAYKAVSGISKSLPIPQSAVRKIYKPVNPAYPDWYNNCQRYVFE